MNKDNMMKMGFGTKAVHGGHIRIHNLDLLLHQYIKLQHLYLILQNKVEEDLL